ncbi:MAG: resolvase [Planctomycetes bacterium]|nr:resolvase [Planctomycetota bacterium]
MNVTIYTRVSTTDQAESGLGLAAQVAACEAFAAKAGHTVTGLHTDAGISGAAGIEDRPGLMAAVAGLRRGDALVIGKRCRLGRDAFVIAVIERAVSRKGAVILSADGVGNGDDPAAVFMKNVVNAAGEFERGLIRSRTRAALAAKRAAGRLTGEVPFGWTADVEGRLIEHADEQAILRVIHELRDAGVSLRRIASILTESGHATKKGRAAWTHTTVKSILDRAAALAA